MNNVLQESKGVWVPAKPLAYSSNIFEKMSCKIGIHGWPIGKKSELKKIRRYIKTLSDPHADEPAIYCYRCDKLLN